MARKYELKRRAERREQTRRRIIEAVVHLHETIGPARTEISAVAERAGVERATVYRHFPDQGSLLAACRDHYLAAHPPPEDSWMQIDDPDERLRAGLDVAYTYYAANEAMMANVLRDAEVMPVGGGFIALQRGFAQALGRGWGREGRQRVRLEAVLGVAVSFDTWRCLVRRMGVTHDEAVDMAARWVRCIHDAGSAVASPPLDVQNAAALESTPLPRFPAGDLRSPGCCRPLVAQRVSAGSRNAGRLAVQSSTDCPELS
jgi:AcrR family transcriptional regulator